VDVQLDKIALSNCHDLRSVTLRDRERVLDRLETEGMKVCYTWNVSRSIVTMKYPFHTESKPVVGEAARKLIEAIESGQAVTNERALALAKRIADRRHQAQANAQSK
jgi:hypothetical protein